MLASVAIIVKEGGLFCGTVNDVVKEPVTVVVIELMCKFCTFMYVNVTLELAANPFPDTVTNVPFEPLGGTSVRKLSVLTLIVTLAEPPPLSVAVKL